jgi:hypothetical protein
MEAGMVVEEVRLVYKRWLVVEDLINLGGWSGGYGQDG